MRLGIFGGSFDPVHLGHLILAETAREQLGLDGLRFLPAARSPHKPDAAPTADAHRVAMLELALAAQPAFALERLDLERPAPSYTVDHADQDLFGDLTVGCAEFSPDDKMLVSASADQHGEAFLVIRDHRI